MEHEIGIIGLSTMGCNLALNIADHKFSTAVYNRTQSISDVFVKQYPHEYITPYHTLRSFCERLKKPRRVMLMIKAGSAIDEVIEQLLNFLEQGDIIIDGGNSFFKDTQRRFAYLKEKGIHYFGVGVSGGETGARFGPAIMPGGDKAQYVHVKHIFEAISAHVENEPCCTFIGPAGAGHYVKMVHNGIEYADMQLISEAYRLLKTVANFTNEEISDIFVEWNNAELNSYLMRISAKILKEKDSESSNDLVDMIVDKSAQKGTGKWTNLEAIALGVDLSIIASALNMRYMSNLLDERIYGKNVIQKSQVVFVNDKKSFIDGVRKSLYVSKIAAYAQGYKLLTTASKEYEWNLDLANITKIFRGGCIIEAVFLQNIVDAYHRDKELKNLMFDEFFLATINENLNVMRTTIIEAITRGIAIPSFINALSYIDTYSSDGVGANLIQAQRDFFGAHTFERIDAEGNYHHEWNDERY